jgi:repressor LexA
MESPDTPDPGHVLTWRQRKVLRVIRDSVRDRGYPPSLREIGDAVGLATTSSVSYQLAKLESKGYLHRDGRKPRTAGIRLPIAQGATEGPGSRVAWPAVPAPEVARVPVVARIAAGEPVLEPERIEDVFPLPRKLVGAGTLFVLTMAGDSMSNAAIADGDWVVVREQADAADGDIVAVTVGDEATVRRYLRSDGHVWLMPHNPAYVPVLGDDAVVLGKIVAVLRRLWQPGDSRS